MKRLLVGGGLSAALTAAYLVGSLTLGVAGAQTPAATQATVQDSSTQQDQTTAPDQANTSEQVSTSSATSNAEQSVVEDQTNKDGQTAEQEATGTDSSQNGGSDGSDAVPQGTASITPDQARATALSQFPGATVSQVQLDDENGKLIYSVELKDASGNSQEVKVDAQTGAVLPADSSDSSQDQQSESGN